MKTILLIGVLATACSNDNTSGGSNETAPSTFVEQTESGKDGKDGAVEPGSSEKPATNGKTDKPGKDGTSNEVVSKDGEGDDGSGVDTSTDVETPAVAMKLTMDNCVDPDLSKLEAGVTMTLCDGTTGTGTYVAPVIVAETHTDCTAYGQTGCIATDTYKSTDLSGLTAANVKKNVTIAGVTGTYDNRPADCTAYDVEGCVTTSTYKPKDLSGLTAAVLKKNVTVAGVTGNYPSVANPLPGTSGAALTGATFNARLADAGTVFEWYDAEGNRYTSSGDANLTAANVKKDVVIFGVTGTAVTTLPSVFDVRYGVTVGSQTGKLDFGCVTSGHSCSTVWEDVTLGGCATHTSACRYKNRNNGLTYGRAGGGFKSLINASTYCSTLTLDGQTGWRLPNWFELQTAAADGIVQLSPSYGGNFTVPTTLAAWEVYGAYVDLDLGTTTHESGSTTHEVMCVK